MDIASAERELVRRLQLFARRAGERALSDSTVVSRLYDAEADVCPVSARYSRELLLVPCHQELEEDDLAWIHGRLAETLTRGSRTRGKT